MAIGKPRAETGEVSAGLCCFDDERHWPGLQNLQRLNLLDDDAIVVVMLQDLDKDRRPIDASVDRFVRDYIKMMCILSVGQIIVMTVFFDALLRAR